MFQNQSGVQPYGIGINQFTQGMNWADSAQEVEKVELPPGTDIVIFNRNKDELYIRSRDRYGYYKTRIFELKDITPEEKHDKYITRDEFESILKKYLGGIKNDTVQSNDGPKPDYEGTTNQSAGGSQRKANDTGFAGSKQS